MKSRTQNDNMLNAMQQLQDVLYWRSEIAKLAMHLPEQERRAAVKGADYGDMNSHARESLLDKNNVQEELAYSH